MPRRLVLVVCRLHVCSALKKQFHGVVLAPHCMMQYSFARRVRQVQLCTVFDQQTRQLAVVGDNGSRQRRF